MDTKSKQITDLLESGNERGALRLAAKFFDRGQATALYKKANDALNNPGFYRQVGQCPDALAGEAITHLKERFINGSQEGRSAKA